MDVAEAREILQNYSGSVEGNGILKGISLVSGLFPGRDLDSDITAEHDQISLGDFETCVTAMGPEEVTKMAKWGWIESDGSWMIYC